MSEADISNSLLSIPVAHSAMDPGELWRAGRARGRHHAMPRTVGAFALVTLLAGGLVTIAVRNDRGPSTLQVAPGARTSPTAPFTASPAPTTTLALGTAPQPTHLRAQATKPPLSGRPRHYRHLSLGQLRPAACQIRMGPVRECTPRCPRKAGQAEPV